MLQDRSLQHFFCSFLQLMKFRDLTVIFYFTVFIRSSFFMTKISFIAAVSIATSFILCSFTGLFNKQEETRVIPAKTSARSKLLTGADQTALYIPWLKGKRVALVGNQTSIIGKKSIVDSLLSLDIRVVKIFGPEHGFRGNASNGAVVKDEIDAATGIPVISLYGKNRKPSKEQMAEIDVMIFDMQDVGCRFYTNINTLANIMESCAENNKELMILDTLLMALYWRIICIPALVNLKFPSPMALLLPNLHKCSMAKDGSPIK
jgi:hypothetical protein